MQRSYGSSGPALNWLNVGLALIAVILWVQIWRFAIHPTQQAQAASIRPATAAHTTAATKDTRKPDDPNEVLRSLMNSDKELHDCLEKANPGDPLGISSDASQHADQRNACLEKYNH